MAGADSYVFNKAPTVADFPQFNGSWINNLPNDYWQGQQYGRERQLQTMFQPGSQGDQALARGDYLGAMRQIAQAGGAQSIAPLLPQFMGISAAQQLMGGEGGPGTGAPAPQPQPRGAYGSAPFAASSSTNGAGPANLSGNPAMGSDNRGDTTVRSLFPGDIDTPQEVMDRVATVIGARPSNGMSAADAPLTPQQAQRAQDIIQKRTGGKAVAQSPITDASTNQPKIETASSEVASNLQSPGSSPTVGPAASANSPNNRAVPQGPSETTGQETTTTGLLPGDSMATLKNLRAAQADQEKRAKAASVFNKELSTRFESSADKLKARADAMEGRLSEKSKTDYGTSVKGREAVQAADIKRGEATFNGIAAASRQYQTDLKPYLDLTKSIINSPGVYTGIGANRMLDINRVRAAFGDQKAAMLQESLNKVRAQAVLNTINVQKDEMMEAGGTSSRIFSQQIAQVEKAVPGLETSLGGNRALVEIASRMGEHQSHVAEMARNYMRRPGGSGYLDQGFDDLLSKELKEHPIFTTQELAHPELLGAPTAPAAMSSKEDLSNWGKSLGLSPGDPFRTQSGKIRALP